MVQDLSLCILEYLKYISTKISNVLYVTFLWKHFYVTFLQPLVAKPKEIRLV